jgi:hypothetical protein
MIALKTGRLVRGPCEHCGTRKYIHAHHDDYDQPIMVRWLCAGHHGEVHRRLRHAMTKSTVNLDPALWRRLRRRAVSQSTMAERMSDKKSGQKRRRISRFSRFGVFRQVEGAGSTKGRRATPQETHLPPARRLAAVPTRLAEVMAWAVRKAAAR